MTVSLNSLSLIQQRIQKKISFNQYFVKSTFLHVHHAFKQFMKAISRIREKWKKGRKTFEANHFMKTLSDIKLDRANPLFKPCK